jgi:hypothetical protein
MQRQPHAGFNRRLLFKLSGAMAATTALVGRRVEQASAHDLTPTDPKYRYREYEAIVNRRGLTVRQVYEWPNVNNPILFGNVRNGLNGFEFSYGIPANAIQVVVQAYGSANYAMYDDTIWEEFKLGELLQINDPATSKPATRNPWYASAIDAADVKTAPEERDDPYYSDTSIEGLQRRGVLFLI